MLEAAVEDGKRALDMDPCWKRGAQRAAEALLSLGDERAQEAVRVGNENAKSQISFINELFKSFIRTL